MTTARVSAVVAAGLLLAWLGAAGAAADWSAPFALDVPPAASTQAAIDPRRTTITVWGRTTAENGLLQIMSRSRTALGTWGRRVPVTGTGVFADVRFVTTARGDSVIGWTRVAGDREYRVEGRTRSARGVLGRPFEVSPRGRGGFLADAALAADGSALFLWRRQARDRDELQGRWRSPSGGLGPVIAVSDPRHASVASPSAAALPGGGALAVWQGLEQHRRYRLYARALVPGRRAGPIVALSDPGGSGTAVVRAAADGRALVVWRTPGGRVQARPRAVSGRFGPIVALSGLGMAVEIGAAEAAVARDGRAAVVWSEPGGRVRARLGSVAGRFGRAIDVSRAHRVVAARPQVAIDGAGAAVIAWTDAADDNDATPRHLLVRRLSPRGRLGPIVTVSSARESAFLPAGGLAAGSGGRAALAWVSLTYVQGVGTYFGAPRASVLVPPRT